MHKTRIATISLKHLRHRRDIYLSIYYCICSTSAVVLLRNRCTNTVGARSSVFLVALKKMGRFLQYLRSEMQDARWDTPNQTRTESELVNVDVRHARWEIEFVGNTINDGQCFKIMWSPTLSRIASDCRLDFGPNLPLLNPAITVKWPLAGQLNCPIFVVIKPFI